MSHSIHDGIPGLRCIKTNAQLASLCKDPDCYPTEVDGRHLCQRLYDGKRMNWCRSLDQVLLIRVVSRNYGYNSSGGASGGGQFELGLPKPSEFFNVIWRLIPNHRQDKIKEWAKKGMDGPIAHEITEHVRQGLRLLPLPVPPYFVNSVTNLVIPPQVSFIISQFGGLDTNDLQSVGLGTNAAEFRLTTPHNQKSLEVLKNLDREILLASGLPPSSLPEHLMEHGDSEDNTGRRTGEYSIMGQPDNRDCRVDISQFYQDDVQNGFKPLQLMQIIAAQVRTNPKCDEEVNTFSAKVWGAIDESTKGKLRRYATERPNPNRKAIADVLYTPAQGILKREPYLVPSPILESFNSVRIPEITEWVVKTQGK